EHLLGGDRPADGQAARDREAREMEQDVRAHAAAEERPEEDPDRYHHRRHDEVGAITAGPRRAAAAPGDNHPTDGDDQAEEKGVGRLSRHCHQPEGPEPPGSRVQTPGQLPRHGSPVSRRLRARTRPATPSTTTRAAPATNGPAPGASSSSAAGCVVVVSAAVAGGVESVAVVEVSSASRAGAGGTSKAGGSFSPVEKAQPSRCPSIGSAGPVELNAQSPPSSAVQ